MDPPRPDRRTSAGRVVRPGVDPLPPALDALLAAVAPGGTLLVVSHTLSEVVQHNPAFDPNDYYHPEDFASQLGEGWAILSNETRPRGAAAPEGGGHAHDVVLRAARSRELLGEFDVADVENL